MKTEKTLLEKINKWGYKKKDNYAEVPEQEHIGKMMPWHSKSLRLAKTRFGQLKDIRWYGWIRFLKFTTISIVFLIASRKLELYLSGADTPNSLFMLTLFIFLFCFFADWAWGERHSNRIRYNDRKELVEFPEGEYGYTVHRDLHLRDLLVVGMPFVIYWFANFLN